MKAVRIIGCVAIITVAFAVGFAAWYWLLGLLFAGMALLGFLMAIPLFAFAKLKKKPSEIAGSLVICATVSTALFCGWYSRSSLREDAMITESLCLIERAEGYRVKEGRYAHSARSLEPVDLQERLVAWIAGDSVRYGGYSDRFCVTRGDAIAGEIYWSDKRTWTVTKL